MIYIELFWSFFKIGLFSFGGGFAAIPLIQAQVVSANGWLEAAQFTDLIAISQMTPGPIAVNASTFVGIQIAGIPGAVAATFGCVLPSCIIVSLLAFLYMRYKHMEIVQGILGGMRPVVVALIASAGMSILVLAIWGESGFSPDGEINFVSLGLFAAALAALRVLKANPVFIMLGTGLVGGIAYLVL